VARAASETRVTLPPELDGLHIACTCVHRCTCGMATEKNLQIVYREVYTAG